MNPYSLSHLSDGALLGETKGLLAREREATAAVVAHLAEVQRRRLYVPAGYPSMFAYCLGELHLSEQAAFKRIRVAKVARRFPEVFPMLAEGRLHLCAIVVLAPHLRPENAAELLLAASHKTRAAVEQLVAERFPRPDLPTRIQVLVPQVLVRPTGPQPGRGTVAGASPVNGVQLSPGTVAGISPVNGAQLSPGTVAGISPVNGAQLSPEKVAGTGAVGGAELSPGTVAGASPVNGVELSPGTVAGTNPVNRAELSPGTVTATWVPPTVHPRVAPLAPERFALQLTVSREVYDKLRHVQELLGHASPSSELADTFERALDALAAHLEKRKFAATDQPRAAHGSSGSGPSGDDSPARHVPAAVKRAVWERDGGRCTFVSGTGRRCEARAGLEFDHMVPVARGGPSNDSNVRLRCRAHNQLAADDAFGAGYMSRKRPCRE